MSSKESQDPPVVEIEKDSSPPKNTTPTTATDPDPLDGSTITRKLSWRSEPVQIRKRSRQTTDPQDGVAGAAVPAAVAPQARKRSTASTFRETVSVLLRPPKKVGVTTTSQSLRAIFSLTWLNVLLICIPISWALHFAKLNDVLVFIFSFISIVPLNKLREFATEELSIRVGQAIGGLINASLGNSVALIVAIISLTQCKLSIVQSSLVGSILSNILLVLGMSFFAGGMRLAEQGFLVSATQVDSTLLTTSIITVLLPAAFLFAVDKGNSQSSSTVTDSLSPQKEGLDILRMSRGVAVILLFIYFSYLYFQLWSHAFLYDSNMAFASTSYPRDYKVPRVQFLKRASNEDQPYPATPSEVRDQDETLTNEFDEDEEIEEPQLNVPVCVTLLVVVTVLIIVTARILVESINGVTEHSGLTQEWIGLILLPILGNAAAHVTTVSVSVTDKLSLCLNAAMGSSIQMALFVIPFVVVLAWTLGKPLTLLFDPFHSIVLFLSVITVNYCIQDGKSNWFKGMIMIGLYLIIAVSLWFYPGVDITTSLPSLKCT